MSDEVKKGPVIWVDKVTKIEERPDMGLALTFEIVDPVTGGRWESILQLPPEDHSRLRNQLILAVAELQ